MSLINDALRKAQKQRTGEAVPLASLPSVGGETAVRIHKRGKPAGFYTLLLRLGLGTGGIVVLVVAGYFVLRSKPADKPATPSSQVSGVSSQASSAPASPVPSPVASHPHQPAATPATVSAPSPQVSPPAPSFNLPIAPPTSAAADPLAQVTSPAAKRPIEPGLSQTTAGGLKSQVSEPVPPVHQPPAAAPKMEGKAINFIENLRIAGIRASATDAKVLMNDRVYRINDIVEHELNLKLVGITSSSLTFEDERGARYTRSF